MTPSSIPTERQVSAGGVAFRRRGGGVDIAIICTGPKKRWQLPKGIVEADESPETAAVREVREEAGIETQLIAPLETVEYWYVARGAGGSGRVRYHKFVHFFLLEYERGDVSGHDTEVDEARWVELVTAEGMLAFESERAVVRQARSLLKAD